MGAQLTIKDEQGRLVLDLSSRITRFTIEYTVTTSPTALLGQTVIRLGHKSERNTFWFFSRYSKTARYNNPNVEGGPFSPFGVYMVDRAEVQASGFNPNWINSVIAKMDTESLYLVIDDTRDYVKNGYQNSVTVDVGRY